MTVGGTVERDFEKVRDAFAEAQKKDRGGAQLCIYRHGRKVVDIWAGADPAANRPYTDKTLTILMSASKGITATLAHILVQRGALDLDAPVARYWPEFAQNGKDGVLIRHLLTHSSGLVNFDADSGFVVEDMCDWDKCVGLLERMAPLWAPGTAYSYHALTYGFLIGEVIRRKTGKRLGEFLQDEVSRPLGVELWFGLPEAEEHRVAQHFLPGKPWDMAKLVARQKEQGVDFDNRLGRAMEAQSLRTFPDFDVLNTRRAYAAEIGAGGAIGNAAALAKFYAALIGTVDGVRLLSDETVERVRAPGPKLMPPGDFAKLPTAAPARPALGYALSTPVTPMLGRGSFGHPGAGGRLAFAHPESGTAVGYTCNNMLWDSMSPDPRWTGWTAALREAIGMEAA
ncbi:MAG: beta-lactamase family protein [Proteobacteria bacterium]|nr:beta-lactamase family protein [Pseudomonadota bacterium]